MTNLYDGRGSVVETINEEKILTSYHYTAYENLLPESPTSKVFGYNAEQVDNKTGLAYLRARYYDTNTGRFISEDIWRGDYTEPVSLNRYAYVYNDPVNYVDINGYARARVSSNDGRIKDVDTLTDNYNTNRRKQLSGKARSSSNAGSNSSAASNNSNLVFNPYSDVIGAEKVTREQMIYICEEYARIMAEENFWYDEEFFSNNWFLDQDKLEEAVNRLVEEIEGTATWELDNTNQMEVIQAILRVQDTNVTGWWDGDTLTNIECRLLAAGLDYSDPMNLTSEDILGIYDSIDQERSDREEWYVNGGSEIISGILVLGGSVTTQYVSNLEITPMSWNEFQHSNAGMYNQTEMSEAYWEYKANFGNATSSGEIYSSSQIGIVNSDIPYEDLATYVNSAIFEAD